MAEKLKVSVRATKRDEIEPKARAEGKDYFGTTDLRVEILSVEKAPKLDRRLGDAETHEYLAQCEVTKQARFQVR